MHKRVIAGALLFCIFACVRWFDAMRIEELSADTHGNIVILEAATALHKTSDASAALHCNWDFSGRTILGTGIH